MCAGREKVIGWFANIAVVHREDCYHLSTLLPVVDSTASSAISTKELTKVFQAFAEKRQPRTAALVRGARANGERRVVTGGAVACRERDEAVKEGWLDEKAVEAKYDYLFREPF